MAACVLLLHATYIAWIVFGAFFTHGYASVAFVASLGFANAMMWPAILGMTYGLLPPSKAGLAGGIILGAAGFGNAFDPMAFLA